MRKFDEKELLIEIKKFYMKNGFPPSIRELCNITGYCSTSSIALLMDRLKEQGEIIPTGKSYTVKGIKVSFDRLY